MSTTATRRRPTPSEGDAPLRAVGDQLRRRGWDARVDTCNVVGDSDERLVVGPAGERSVELLGRWGDAPCADRWHAVLVGPEGRVVWCGPPHACDPADLVRFVEDLLRNTAELTGRYTRLG